MEERGVVDSYIVSLYLRYLLGELKATMAVTMAAREGEEGDVAAVVTAHSLTVCVYI